MIADRYLRPRSELETALNSLLELGSETHRATSWLEIVQGLLTNVREPLLVVVLGDAKSGKSTLLNALFEQDFATIDVVPAADRIHLFRHGTEEKTVDLSARLSEHYLPLTFLRDFKIVDTLGTDRMLPEDRQFVHDFIEHADLVLLVLSVVNPWTQASLDFVASIEKVYSKNIVFVLQQVDRREPGEIDVIRRHLEDIATQKIGFTPLIFDVSAEDALLGRRTGPEKHRRRMESQFGPLREQINLVLAESGERTHKLRSACQIAHVLLHDISTEVRTAIDVIGHDEARLTRVKTLLQMRKEQTQKYVKDLLHQVEQSSKKASAQGLHLLKDRLSFGQIWKIIRGQFPRQRDFQLEIDRTSRESIERQIEETAQLLENDLRGVWPQLHDLIEQLTSNIKADVLQAPPDFARQRRELLQSIRTAMNARAAGSNAEEELAQLFRRTALWLRFPAGAALICAVTALLALKISFAIAGFAAGLAALGVAIGVAIAFYRRTKILSAYRRQMQRRVVESVELISSQLNETIDSFHNQIEAAVELLAARCATQRESSEPLLHRADKLQSKLIELASQLR